MVLRNQVFKVRAFSNRDHFIKQLALGNIVGLDFGILEVRRLFQLLSKKTLSKFGTFRLLLKDIIRDKGFSWIGATGDGYKRGILV